MSEHVPQALLIHGAGAEELPDALRTQCPGIDIEALPFEGFAEE